MNFSQRVSFISEGTSKYIPNKGYINNSKVVASEVANVTNLGAVKSVQLFGEIKQGQKVIRTPNFITKKWTYVEMENKKYKLVTELETSKGYAVIVGEVK